MPCNGITHEEKLFCLAVGIAEAMKRKDATQVGNACELLEQMLTKEDTIKAAKLRVTHLQKCNCKKCQAGLAVLEAMAKMIGKSVHEMVDETIEAEAQETHKTTPPDDSFAV